MSLTKIQNRRENIKYEIRRTSEIMFLISILNIIFENESEIKDTCREPKAERSNKPSGHTLGKQEAQSMKSYYPRVTGEC